jgi:hypothetical protein
MEINRLYSMMGSGTEALQYIAILIAMLQPLVFSFPSTPPQGASL